MLYSKENINKINKSNRNAFLISGIFLGFVVIFIIVSAFFIKDGNVILFKILYSIFLSVGFIGLAYSILSVFLINSDKKKFIKKILNSEIDEIKILIKSISETKLIRKNIYGREISCLSNEKEFVLFIEEKFLNDDVKIDNNIVVKTSYNFIVEIKHD